MSKKKIAGIVVGCIIAIIVIVAIATHPSVLPPLGPSQLAISGTYILTEASTSSSGLFEEWDIGEIHIDLENDGTFYLRFTDAGVAYLGEWTLNGNTIELQTEMWGSPIVWTGTVNGDTISLEDGSVWKK